MSGFADFGASSVLGGGMPGGIPPLQSSASSRSGDIYATSQFNTGPFGSGASLQQLIADNWMVIAIGIGAYVLFVKRKK